MNKSYVVTTIAAFSLGACLAVNSAIAHSESISIPGYTAIGLLATQTTCKGHSINTIVVNIPGFKSRSACEKFLIPNAHTKDFLGTDGEICRINYNFDGLCIAMSDE